MHLSLVISVTWVVISLCSALYLHYVYQHLRPTYTLAHHLRKVPNPIGITTILCKPIECSVVQVYLGIPAVWSGFWDLELDACKLCADSVEFSTHVSWVAKGDEQKYEIRLVDSLQDALLPRVLSFNQILFLQSERLELPGSLVGLTTWLCLGIGPYLAMRASLRWLWLKCFAK